MLFGIGKIYPIYSGVFILLVSLGMIYSLRVGRCLLKAE